MIDTRLVSDMRNKYTETEAKTTSVDGKLNPFHHDNDKEDAK